MPLVAAKSARLVALGLGVSIALAVLFYPTDEKRVREAADALLTAANASPGELSQALELYASPQVRIDVTELSEPIVGRDALMLAVRRAREFEPNLRFRLEGVEVSVEGKRARLSADLITTLRPEVPELRKPRHAAASFEKRGERFQLISAEIGNERLDQPEARP
jgi:hypothetical protein